MKRKTYSTEQIVAAVKQYGLGMPVADIARILGIAEQTSYRWKKQFGWSGRQRELLSNLVYGGLVMRRPCCPL